ncbi:MAG: CDP-alcohol phosphatidyltransferase family protein [Firmicutes bacterium]|nr:CDP-alcohol phosphatidyltransferase family protein [Bacillota bacterium]
MSKNILKHVPNTLTMIRFFLIPILVILIFQKNFVGAFIVLAVSGITDILDGHIARHFNLVTDFGKLMDPLADKITQLAILIILCVQQIVPVWILLVVVVKEFAMISGASFLYGKELVVSSRWYGKLATVIFYIAIVCSLAIRYWNSILVPSHSFASLPFFDTYIYYLATLAAIFSLIMYFKAFYVQGYLKKDY